MKFTNVKIRNTDKLNLFVTLGIMLAAGIPILEVVDSLLEESSGPIKIFLETLREDISQGKTISSTMAKFPSSFDKVTVNVLRLAEESGTLETSIKEVQINLQKEIKFHDKVRAAALYPLIVIVVFLLVVLTILFFVIPRVASVFTALKITLPLPTKILLFLSNSLIYHTPIVLTILMVIVAGSVLVYVKKRNWLINKLTSFPLIRKIAREIDLTRLSRSLSLLLSTGMPITSGLELAQSVVVKDEIRQIVSELIVAVTSGRKMSEALRKSPKIIPKFMVKMTEAGERTGSLENSMRYISEYLEYQVEKTLATIATLLEPALLVVIGIVVGSIMLSIIGPIYSLIGQIGPK